jgi:FKBP-type peptidyl-prolyl cis-trans isomerase 2
MSITAGTSLPDSPAGKELAFEEEIANRLAGVIVGMKEGETRTVKLSAEDQPERRSEDYVTSVARVRERAKEVRMNTGDYKFRSGQYPEVGQTFHFDPAVSGRVENVTQDEVIVRFSAHTGDIVPTPFGPGHIRETEKAYQIEIEARRGDLVRSGPLVGRITGVDDRYITIDYRNPFGGAILTCDVNVGKITEAKQISDSKGTSPKGDGAADK